jgi:hypothetical protein
VKRIVVAEPQHMPQARERRARMQHRVIIDEEQFPGVPRMDQRQNQNGVAGRLFSGSLGADAE